MVYVMNTQDTVLPPDAGYYRIIDDGYTHFDFDKKLLKKALNEACVNHKLA